jgi:hypothetical protein
MSLKEKLAQRGIEVARREFGDHHELIADFVPSTDITVDVVGDTVIVVAAAETYDLEVDGPAERREDIEGFLRNAVYLGAALAFLDLGGTEWPYAITVGF